MLYRCPACDAPSGSCGESECAMVAQDSANSCYFQQDAQPSTTIKEAPGKKINISSGEDVVLA